MGSVHCESAVLLYVGSLYPAARTKADRQWSTNSQLEARCAPSSPTVVAVAAKQAVARKNHQTHRGLRWARRNLIRRHQRVIVLSRRPKHRLSAWSCAVDVRTIHRYMWLPLRLLEPLLPCPRREGLERHTSHRTRQRLFRDWTLPCN